MADAYFSVGFEPTHAQCEGRACGRQDKKGHVADV